MGKNKGKHKEQGEKTNVMRMLEAEGVPYAAIFTSMGMKLWTVFPWQKHWAKPGAGI